MTAQTTAARNRDVLERVIRAVSDRDFETFEANVHPDFVQEIPQSGERVVGIENFWKVLTNLPGPGSRIVMRSDPHIAGDGSHFVMTPTFNVVKVDGDGDELTSYLKVRYPDGSDWYIVTFSSFKDGRMVRRVDFFAPFFDPPAWRAQWVQVTER